MSASPDSEVLRPSERLGRYIVKQIMVAFLQYMCTAVAASTTGIAAAKKPWGLPFQGAAAATTASLTCYCLRSILAALCFLAWVVLVCARACCHRHCLQ